MQESSAPSALAVEPLPATVPKSTTIPTEAPSSEKSLSNTTRRRKRKTEEILQDILQQKKEVPANEHVEIEETQPDQVKEAPEEQSEQEPPQKKVRVTEIEEEPSLFRGVFVKPLLLATLGSLTFLVSNFYSTTKKPVALKKKKELQLNSALSKTPRIAGFT